MFFWLETLLLSPFSRCQFTRFFGVTSKVYFFLQLICTIKSTHKVKSIPVIVRLTDINDNSPQFVGVPYETSISEVSP